MIILAAVFSVVTIPVKFAVNPELGESGTFGNVYYAVDLTTYIMYWLDIFISLRTTFIDSFGEEIKDKKVICCRYLTSLNFYIDLVSLLSLPTRGVQTNKFLSFFGILKVVRITRLLKLITQSHYQKGSKVFLKIAYYFILFLFYLHIVGCLWFSVIEATYHRTEDHYNWCQEHLEVY